jgi:hypothetical protein
MPLHQRRDVTVFCAADEIAFSMTGNGASSISSSLFLTKMASTTRLRASAACHSSRNAFSGSIRADLRAGM